MLRREKRSWGPLGGSLPGLGLSSPLGTMSKEHELRGAYGLDLLERLPWSLKVKAKALPRDYRALQDPPLPTFPLSFYVPTSPRPHAVSLTPSLQSQWAPDSSLVRTQPHVRPLQLPFLQPRMRKPHRSLEVFVPMSPSEVFSTLLEPAFSRCSQSLFSFPLILLFLQ